MKVFKATKAIAESGSHLNPSFKQQTNTSTETIVPWIMNQLITSWTKLFCIITATTKSYFNGKDIYKIIHYHFLNFQRFVSDAAFITEKVKLDDSHT